MGEGLYRAYLTARYRQRDAFEIYAVGESSTYGQPYGPSAAFPELVKMMFEARLAGRPIVVHNLGRPGDTMYPQSVDLLRMLKVRDKSEPAVVLIYSGHNESFQRTEERPYLAGSYSALKRELLYHSLLASDLLILFERRSGFQGLRDFVDYDYHVRRVIEASRQSGALPILSTVIGNVGGVEPNVACVAGDQPPGPSCASVSELLEPGLRLERAGRSKQALALYDGLLADHRSLEPLLRYRIAKCLEAQGRFALARHEFWRAIDAEGPGTFGRAKTGLNDYLKRIAKEYAIPLVDAVALFESHSPHGIVGNELMSDGHHPNMQGYLILAEGFARQISRAFSEPIHRTLDEQDAFREAGLGSSEQARALTDSGLWLLFVSIGHPEAQGRFELAERRFESAAALDPEDYKAWSGLALAQAARRKGMPLDPAYADAVRRWVFSNGCPPAGEAAALAQRMKAEGVDASVLEGMLRAGTRPCGSLRN